MPETSRRNRRHFLQQSGATLSGLLAAPALGASPLAAEALQGPATGRPEPDLIVGNATVSSSEKAKPVPSALRSRNRSRRPEAVG